MIMIRPHGFAEWRNSRPKSAEYTLDNFGGLWFHKFPDNSWMGTNGDLSMIWGKVHKFKTQMNPKMVIFGQHVRQEWIYGCAENNAPPNGLFLGWDCTFEKRWTLKCWFFPVKRKTIVWARPEKINISEWTSSQKYSQIPKNKSIWKQDVLQAVNGIRAYSYLFNKWPPQINDL